MSGVDDWMRATKAKRQKEIQEERKSLAKTRSPVGLKLKIYLEKLEQGLKHKIGVDSGGPKIPQWDRLS